MAIDLAAFLAVVVCFLGAALAVRAAEYVATR
jgi:TRAP-type C4-dicarboxylate transport system permease small subunit